MSVYTSGGAGSEVAARRPFGPEERSQMAHPFSPRAQGLYDPRFEHDACGIGFVVDIARAAGRTPSSTRRCRCCSTSSTAAPAAARRTPATAPASSCRCRTPSSPTCAARRASCCPGRGATASAWSSCRRDAADRAPLRGDRRADRRRGGPRLPRLARRSRPTTARSARPRAPASRSMRQVFIARPDAIEDDLAFERKLYVARRRIENAVRASDVPGRASSTSRACRTGRSSTRGCSSPRSCRRSSPTSSTRASSRALAMVHSRFSHEHVPDLGARAPVPLHLPQRRDQHAARQRQLDARPREPVRVEALRRRPQRRSCPSSTPTGSDSAMFDNVLELLVPRRPRRCRTR